MIYLLDTNTLVHMIRGLKHTPARHVHQRGRFWQAEKIAACCRQQQTLGHEVGLSAITVAELEYGAHHSGDYEREIGAVKKILSPFACYEFDPTACAAIYGRLRQALESRGQSIGAMDLLIAAHALALSATLITNDAHFTRVPDLTCENWML